MSQEGSKYYVDHNSGKTQWDRPTVSNAVRSATLPRAGQQYAFAMIKPHDPHSLSANSRNWLYIMHAGSTQWTQSAFARLFAYC
jgi:hypothetical protein